VNDQDKQRLARIRMEVIKHGIEFPHHPSEWNDEFLLRLMDSLLERVAYLEGWIEGAKAAVKK
jgi:hypothetical protein